MAEEKLAVFTRKMVMLGLISTAIVFVFFTIVLRPFVPDQAEVATWLWSAITASALTLVFFLAFNSLAIILADPKFRKH